MPSVRKIVPLVVVALMAVAPVVQSQALVPSGIELQGSHPETIHVRLGEEVNYTVVYRYRAGAGHVGDTKVHLSVEEKPDWLQIDHEDTITMEIDPVRRKSTQEVDFVFRIRRSQAPVAFHPEQVSLGVRAEQNGYIAGSNNTHTFFPKVSYRPEMDIRVGDQPIRVPADGVTHADVEVTNRGNAPVIPSFDVIQSPSGADVKISSVHRRLEPFANDPANASTSANLVVEDTGQDWSVEPVEVQVTYVPFRRPDGPVTVAVQEVWASKGSGVGGSLIPTIPVAIGLVGAALYLRRRDEPVWPDSGS